MKKLICLLLTALLVCSLAACGGANKGSENKDDGDKDFVWTRQGYFSDEEENILSILPSEFEEYPGWYVGCFLGDDMYGWYIQQEGKTLHGNIVEEGGEEEFIVTVSEEGEDGVLLATPDGKTYHFKPMEMPDATIFVHINTEGRGAICYAEGEETPEFDPDYPYQSAQINLAEPKVHTLLAVSNVEGWQFVKWTKDGEDYSTDAQITVELAESADYVAVFEELYG